LSKNKNIYLNIIIDDIENIIGGNVIIDYLNNRVSVLDLSLSSISFTISLGTHIIIWIYPLPNI